MFSASLGFHTFTMFVRFLQWEQANALLQCFKRYSRTVGGIIIYKTGKYKSDYRIEFIGEDRGVSWTIRFCNHSPEFRRYSIEATINPKILAGIKDYITASDETCLENLEPRYNALVRSISDEIPLFANYLVNRIDYCINFRLKKDVFNCTPRQMIELIQKGDIPKHYNERYNPISHRRGNDENSFYLKSDSVNVNCYWKYAEWLANHPDREGIEDSFDVIRFEIQCKRDKVYPIRREMTKNIINSELLNYRITTHLLSNDKAADTVMNYFSKIIKHGDYYTLRGAKQEIKKHGFYKSSVELLTNVLELVNTHRGISKARNHLDEANISKNDFNHALRILAQICVNPVTIPKSWKIDYIPSLLWLLGE